MKDIIDKATVRAIAWNADGATQQFYAHLKEKRFRSTRCEPCGRTAYPPRPFCPHCGKDSVEWVDLPTRGTLHAFSSQHRSLRFFAPDVLGLVELPDVGFVFTKIDAKLKDLSIGEEVELDFFEICPDLVVHQFRPRTFLGGA